MLSGGQNTTWNNHCNLFGTFVRFFSTPRSFFSIVIYQIRLLYSMCMNNFTLHNLQSSNTIRYGFLYLSTPFAQAKKKTRKKLRVMTVKGEKQSQFIGKRAVRKERERGRGGERRLSIGLSFHQRILEILVFHYIKCSYIKIWTRTQKSYNKMPFSLNKIEKRNEKRFVHRAAHTWCIIAITHIMQSSGQRDWTWNA